MRVPDRGIDAAGGIGQPAQRRLGIDPDSDVRDLGLLHCGGRDAGQRGEQGQRGGQDGRAAREGAGAGTGRPAGSVQSWHGVLPRTDVVPTRQRIVPGR
ncbi:hypothetical protein EASAB2608_07147 [Streptomyces sp. EAS-AB2608]|nr:hypothetical protein EASAB2608_07147 [Streptomyces sp. EAS-AB2608]